MADAEKLKKRKSNLPYPPPYNEVSENIHPQSGITDYERIDGRSLRRTGRTVQFNTRVTPAFDMKLREIAQKEGITLSEVLEKSLVCYEKQNTDSI
jgi:hypothetical protein